MCLCIFVFYSCFLCLQSNELVILYKWLLVIDIDLYTINNRILETLCELHPFDVLANMIDVEHRFSDGPLRCICSALRLQVEYTVNLIMPESIDLHDVCVKLINANAKQRNLILKNLDRIIANEPIVRYMVFTNAHKHSHNRNHTQCPSAQRLKCSSISYLQQHIIFQHTKRWYVAQQFCINRNDWNSRGEHQIL